jgi:F-type H+-transporting ATPase subunit b
MPHRGSSWIGALLCAAVLCVPGAASLAWAAEAAAEHGGGGLISIDKSLIVQMVNFLILLFLLHRLLYRPLVQKMNERTEAIKTSLEEAKRARADAARAQEQNAEQLRAAHAEAAAIRAAALKEAAEEQRKLLERARAESQQIVDRGRAELDADLRQARAELRREVADLAVAAAEKLVRKSLRDEDHRRIVTEAIGRMGN